MLSVRDTDKGTLELGFTIVVPPGRLGQYTKVVQFWPRLVVVNRLQHSLVLEQNSTLRYELMKYDEVVVSLCLRLDGIVCSRRKASNVCPVAGWLSR